MRALAYLAGVVRGDAWCTTTLGLRVADADFAVAFAAAIWDAFGVTTRARLDERGYWLVRVRNTTGRFDVLRSFQPSTTDEWSSWLRGMFDSEGNASLRRQLTVSPNAFGRRVAFFSTDLDTLSMVERGLQVIGVFCRSTRWNCGPGHKGTRPVHAVEVRGGRENYLRFGRSVGSSIRRKAETLEAIPRSYQPPGHHARMQLRGVATRRARRDAGGIY